MAMMLTGDLLHDKCFYFNGKCSADFRLIVSGGGTYKAPIRSYEKVQVPGRNGSLLIDNGYYEDAEVTYEVGFLEDDPGNPYDSVPIEARLDDIRNWLLAPTGYVRLEDAWHPDEYRMGYISSDFDPDMLQGLEGGTVTLTFTCKPQRFLKSGEDQMTITGGQAFGNPTDFPSLPLLTLTGPSSGYSITIWHEGGDTQQIKVNGQSSAVTIDCEIMDAYRGTTNLNSYVTFTTNNYNNIVFPGGTNTVTLDMCDSCKAVPRWWRL